MKGRQKKLGIAVVLTLAGVLIGVQSIMFPISAFDRIGVSIAEWTAKQSAAFISAMRFITHVGDWWVITSLGLVSVAGSAVRFGKMSKRLVPPATGMVGVWLLNELIKAMVARDRPIIPWLIDKSAASGHSFPSGHAMNSMGCFMIMASTVPARYRGPARVLAFALSILIGMSRVAVGVHYFSDVLAGWCFGMAFAVVYEVLISSKWMRRAVSAVGKRGLG